MCHAGVGSTTHTFGVFLNSILGVKPTMVPFNGAAQASNALIAGQVDYMCDGLNIGQQVNAGLVRAYAIGTKERHSSMPNLPTAIEAGLPEFQAAGWWALFAPKGMPQAVLDRLTDALNNALNDDGVRKRFAELSGYAPA